MNAEKARERAREGESEKGEKERKKENDRAIEIEKFIISDFHLELYVQIGNICHYGLYATFTICLKPTPPYPKRPMPIPFAS